MAELARILAATDFSAAADRATQRAVSLTSTLKGTLHLVHVLPPRDVLQQLFLSSLQREIDALWSRAERELQERASRIDAQSGIKPSCEILQGQAHQAILDATKSSHATVVVLGARGEREEEDDRSADTVGGTAFKVAARSSLPTLLVRTAVHEAYAHVVACAKGGTTDRALVEWANRISPDNPIHVLSACTVPYGKRLIEWGASHATLDLYASREQRARIGRLSELLNEIDLPAARARLHVERGEPLEAILRNAAHWKADLIVVGRSARPGPLPFGSIARSVAVRAPTDVMIVSQ